MSAISRIGAAIEYKADERILAYGGSFAAFQEMAIRIACSETSDDECPISSARTELATVRPGSK